MEIECKLTRRVFIAGYVSLVQSTFLCDGDLECPMTMADLGEMLTALSAHGQHHRRELSKRWVRIGVANAD